MSISIDDADSNFESRWTQAVHTLRSSGTTGECLVTAVEGNQYDLRIAPCSDNFFGCFPINKAKGVSDRNTFDAKYAASSSGLHKEREFYRLLGAFDGAGCGVALDVSVLVDTFRPNFICCTNATNITSILNSLVIEIQNISDPQYLAVALGHECIHALRVMSGRSVAWDEFDAMTSKRKAYCKKMWMSEEEKMTVGRPICTVKGIPTPNAVTENMLRLDLKLPQRLTIRPLAYDVDSFNTLKDFHDTYRSNNGY